MMFEDMAWTSGVLERQAGEARAIATLSLEARSKLAMQRNRDKGTWEKYRPYELIQLLQKEQMELAAAVVAVDWNDEACVDAVARECADVAGFCAFILDNARRGVWKR